VKEVNVRLWIDGDTLAMLITDQGYGFDSQLIATYASTGLHGMAERAALVDGSLTIETAAGVGTRVAAALPLQWAIQSA
jgi:signal transduction histidine kinase